jgi:hypothetical protein
VLVVHHVGHIVQPDAVSPYCRIGDPATTWKDYAPNPAGTRYGYQFLPNQTFSLAPQLADSRPYVWPADKLKAFSSNKDPKNGPVFEPPRTHQDLVAVVDAGAKISKTRSKYDTDTASFWALGSGVGGGSNSISGAFLDIAQKVRGSPRVGQGSPACSACRHAQLVAPAAS